MKGNLLRKYKNGIKSIIMFKISNTYYIAWRFKLTLIRLEIATARNIMHFAMKIDDWKYKQMGLT